MNLNLSVGDIILGGRFKNKRIEVKSLGTDELGQPIVNKSRKLLSVRIEKLLPKKMQSFETQRREMEKKAILQETYDSAFRDELEKIAKEPKTYAGTGAKIGAGLGAGLGAGEGLYKGLTSGILRRSKPAVIGTIIGSGLSNAILNSALGAGVGALIKRKKE